MTPPRLDPRREPTAKPMSRERMTEPKVLRQLQAAGGSRLGTDVLYALAEKA